MNINRSNKENGFTLRKARSKRFPAETVTDAHYRDDLELLANTSVQADSLLHCQEQENRIEVMYFKQERAISTLCDRPIKSVDLFPILQQLYIID